MVKQKNKTSAIKHKSALKTIVSGWTNDIMIVLALVVDVFIAVIVKPAILPKMLRMVFARYSEF